MRINVERLVPRGWTVEIMAEKMHISYVHKGRSSSPKPFILPRCLEIDEHFIEALGMYMGDGKLSKLYTLHSYYF